MKKSLEGDYVANPTNEGFSHIEAGASDYFLHQSHGQRGSLDNRSAQAEPLATPSRCQTYPGSARIADFVLQRRVFRFLDR